MKLQLVTRTLSTTTSLFIHFVSIDEDAHESKGVFVGVRFVGVHDAAGEVQGILVDYRIVGHSAVKLEGVAPVAVLPAFDGAGL